MRGGHGKYIYSNIGFCFIAEAESCVNVLSFADLPEPYLHQLPPHAPVHPLPGGLAGRRVLRKRGTRETRSYSQRKKPILFGIIFQVCSNKNTCVCQEGFGGVDCSKVSATFAPPAYPTGPPPPVPTPGYNLDSTPSNTYVRKWRKINWALPFSIAKGRCVRVREDQIVEGEEEEEEGRAGSSFSVFRSRSSLLLPPPAPAPAAA